jgi:hypothetical protein
MVGSSGERLEMADEGERPRPATVAAVVDDDWRGGEDERSTEGAGQPDADDEDESGAPFGTDRASSSSASTAAVGVVDALPLTPPLMSVSSASSVAPPSGASSATPTSVVDSPRTNVMKRCGETSSKSR